MVGEAGQAGGSAGVDAGKLGVTVQHGHHLLTGDDGIGREGGAVAGAGDHVVLVSPEYGVAVILAVSHIGEGVAAADSGLAGQTVQ